MNNFLQLQCGWYLVASVAAFGCYGLDKTQAMRGAGRIPETVLHFLGVLGGWPGSWLGQYVFRHKTQKRTFQGVFWGTVLLNLAGVSILNFR